MKKVLIYTDGSCLKNPGPGGWAAILQLAGTVHSRELCGGYRLTTNNRMEIMAAIKALQALKEPCEVHLYTDSQYLRNAVEKKWLSAWQKAAWKKSNNKPVLNSDLWRLLLEAMAPHLVKIYWLRGHSGHPGNERCDLLSRTCAKKNGLPPDEVFELSQAE